ncbi:hypothetical protein HPB51_017841 [Rhipicephalus microplus]|uniref:Uncharacterized protein n=1 Tax=Rhipicephalus microplus TaxID=6941 RepID=A0A9J6E2A6_RHIMP|nr:hypothetical protein HPB51_017841 [Rhipicephalus microplus]
MTTLLSAVQQKQQQQVIANVAAYHQRPRSVYERPFVAAQKSARVQPTALPTHTLVTLSPSLLRRHPGGCGQCFSLRLWEPCVLQRAVQASACGQPGSSELLTFRPFHFQVPSRPAAITVSTASHTTPSPHQQQQAAQAVGEGHQLQPQPQPQHQQFRYPKSNLTLLLTPTVRHGTLSTAPGFNLSTTAPASILIHSQPAGQFRHPLAPPAGLVHVSRFQTAQASTPTSATPDSATKPRRTAAGGIFSQRSGLSFSIARIM